MHHNSVIGFFYPTRGIGGAQYLFARMAEYLIENTSYDVVLIDYSDGFIRGKLGDRSYIFIEYKDGKTAIIQEPLLLVLSLSFLPFIGKYLVLHKATKLFFWDLHPYNLVEQLALSGLYKLLRPKIAHRMCSLIERTRYKKIVQFVECSARAHGIVFMAERNKIYNEQLIGFSSQVGYLPIPIDTSMQPTSQGLERRKDVGSSIHIGWLSRLDSWKTAVLFRLLDDIRAYEEEHGYGTIHVHVIGSGKERSSVGKRCAGIRVSMAGNMEGSALTEYMLANLHLGFAMGTSALEFAARGIPTVLTPSRITQVNSKPDKIYRWLFDSQGYDVAAEEDRRFAGLHAFSDIVQRICSSGVEQLGNQCQTYTIENHDMNKVGAMLVDYLSKCTLHYGDLRQLNIFQATPYERLLFRLKRFFKRYKRGSIGATQSKS